MTMLAPIPKTTENPFAKIDTEIARLLDLVRQLRARRNTLPTINRLPRELLREIMHYAKDSVMTEDSPSYEWMNVAQVCQHWREVALDCSTLWATICIPPAMKWMDELCLRSRSVPLSFDISSHVFVGYTERLERYLFPSKCTKIADLLLRQLHRIRDLRLNVDAGDEELVVPLTAPAPILERLQINGYSRALHLPNDLFSATVPNLQQLDLELCSFSWSTPLLAETLQYLRIVSPKTRIPMDQIMHILTSLPRLHHLELDSALPNGPHIEWETFTFGSGPIQVPVLHTLSLKDEECDNVADFLSRIHIHDTLRLRLWAGGPNFGKFLKKVAFPAGTSSLASTHMSSGFDLRMSLAPLGAAGTEELSYGFFSAGHLWLEIGARSSSAEFRFESGQICEMIADLPLEHLTACIVTGSSPVLQYPLSHKVSQLPNLKTLVLEGTGAAVLHLVWTLNERIPQCQNHKQYAMCGLELEQDWESEDEDDDMDGESESLVGDGDDEGGDLVEGASVSKSASTIASYRSLLEDAMPCQGCNSLGQTFFPALEDLIVREVNLLKWWMASKTMSSMNPLVEFVVRRIRCGLLIKEIRFEPGDWQRDWPSSEQSLQDLFDDLCGEFSPTIIVKHPVSLSNDEEDGEAADQGAF
ncbi:hypothetical protein AX16_010452 [Volvariella volvacea WC 439]|nr:hypothetical protein AX16_010452 [Volvariella volvacea WC 439]